MADEQQRKSGIGGIGDGIRTGIGILNSLREAVEETFQEAVSRGDMSQEGAKNAMKDVAQRLQSSLEDARERFDFAGRKEHDDLRAEVQLLRERVARLEAAGGAASSPPIVVTD